MSYQVPTILVVGDLHFPFANAQALATMFRRTSELNITRVVQIGDLYDAYVFSRFPKALSRGMSGAEELARGEAQARRFWTKARTVWPQAKLTQLRGNHDIRAEKKIAALAPELMLLAHDKIQALYSFPGVTTHMQAADAVEIAPGVLAHHGHRAKLGDHMLYNNARTVVGHSHTGGVVYMSRKGATIWELNAGWLGDAKQGPFRYGEQQTQRRWTVGYGLIDAFGPRFVPL